METEKKRKQFSIEEKAEIIELAKEGFTNEEIAKMVNSKFGTNRTKQTISTMKRTMDQEKVIKNFQKYNSYTAAHTNDECNVEQNVEQFGIEKSNVFKACAHIIYVLQRLVFNNPSEFGILFEDEKSRKEFLKTVEDWGINKWDNQ